MFKIESYITPILLSYVDKYVRDFKPADAQVSLWGGGVVLHNLVLKADVLQREVALPFTLVSGRIHELFIQVPWTKIMSEPIVVTIDTIECVLGLHPPSSDENPSPEPISRKTQVVETPPGYMQALVRRIVSNIALKVHHLIVKYVQDDIVLSLNVKHLSVHSTGEDWKPSFADIDQVTPVLRRLVQLDDLTLCLDRSDTDGKIRFYQEPLLYRCQLDLRVLTRLVSANTRRATTLSFQLNSSKLAFGVTNDQASLLLRLLKERSVLETKPPQLTTVKISTTAQATLQHSNLSNLAEPARVESWSEWAWSWLPSWMDREGGVEEAPVPATPTPIIFSAYLDEISVIFKVMEQEGGSRKRPRGILEVIAIHAAIRIILFAPTTQNIKMAMRNLILKSNGKCVCGHVDIQCANEEPTIYLQRIKFDENEEFEWPEMEMDFKQVETAELAEEDVPSAEHKHSVETAWSLNNSLHEAISHTIDVEEDFWTKMAPLIYLEYSHERSPPAAYTNPYENPPSDFQFSDWREDCKLTVILKPLELRLCMGLFHRVAEIRKIYQDLIVPPAPETPMRVLTIEECDALFDNLPQRRISIDIKDIRIRMYPWDHSLTERPVKPLLSLDVDIARANIIITCPLYPHRVCSAACQMPDNSNPLWQGARIHLSATFLSMQAQIRSVADGHAKPCLRADFRFVVHMLLHQYLFTKPGTVMFSFSIKIREVNISGSAARLQAAYQVITSLVKQNISMPLRYTNLAKDALKDEELVALDMTVEDLFIRGYHTKCISTYIVTLQTARITALHSLEGEQLKQAWILSAPDVPSGTPYLRAAVQWCWETSTDSLDYLGIWTEPTAVCVDPLFIAWLAYAPRLKPLTDSQPALLPRTMSSTMYFLRRRGTQSSSSGVGGSRSGSGAELVHGRLRSTESFSEPSDKKEYKETPATTKSKSESPIDPLLKFHGRLRHMLVTVEMGLMHVYCTETTVSAVDCPTMRIAMERHVESLHSVLVFNMGRWSMFSNSMTKHLWQEIRHDGPTFICEATAEGLKESFPWKIIFADISCYTLELRGDSEHYYDKSSSGLRSHLKPTHLISPRTILDLVTTTLTLSIVTKSVAYRTMVRKPEQKKSPEPEKEEEKKTKYFTAGSDFKPSTLKEFVRGPASRKKGAEEPDSKTQETSDKDTHRITPGPIVSIGVNLHADTPPVLVKLDQDQVRVVAAAMHCFRHIMMLLQRPPLIVPKKRSIGSNTKSFKKCTSETDDLQSSEESNGSEGPSELVAIFQAHPEQEIVTSLKKVFWAQWVISRATVIIATDQVKLAFNVDDIISSIDLQEHYNQFKVKIASASVKHYVWNNSVEEWKAGVLGGRILEVREACSSREDDHFLTVTITQAQISNLPASWKEELHPKLLEQKENVDSMWEVYATLAPLEAVLQPNILDNIVSVMHEMAPRSFCPLQTETTRRGSWQWPFCYITAGGLRLLLACQQQDKKMDDTFVFSLGRISVNPHPENPICRRPITPTAESGWLTVEGGFEGRQYEMYVKDVEVHSAQLAQLIDQEESTSLLHLGGENPAHKWSKHTLCPSTTPVLHSVDVSCVIAPALFIGTALVCGPGVEFNLMSDCSIEISVDQLVLFQRIATQIGRSFRDRVESNSNPSIEDGVCPYAAVLTGRNPVEEVANASDATIIEEIPKTSINIGQSLAGDSGVETNPSRSKLKSARTFVDNTPLTKKSVSVAFYEYSANPKEFIEVFVTVGTIELSLYTVDDDSPNMVKLRPEKLQTGVNKDDVDTIIEEESGTSIRPDVLTLQSKSVTEANRHYDEGMTKFENDRRARHIEGCIPLIYVTLQQPNLYYWKKKYAKNFQISLFNAWVGLGGGIHNNDWRVVLIETARGVPDPVTEIPPALATMKILVPVSGTSFTSSSTLINSRGTLRLDIERPLKFEVSMDRLIRLKTIYELIEDKLARSSRNEPDSKPLPLLYTVRRYMTIHNVESATIQTSQIAVCGFEGSAGWDSASLQIACSQRPEKLLIRALCTSLLVSSGPPQDSRHQVLHPLQLGMELDATWEAWRRVECGSSIREPTVHVGFDLDRVTIELRPGDLEALHRMHEMILKLREDQRPLPTFTNSSENIFQKPPVNFQPRLSSCSIDSIDFADHYYKDDLRSGAFKIVRGGQLPMAYQVMLHENAVSWRYPHPRAVTRLVAFPLPRQDEVECVLEVYNAMLSRWESHTYFNIPVSEPREIQLYVPAPEGIFATVWRFRVRSCKQRETPYEFRMAKFLPRQDPLVSEQQPDYETEKCGSDVTAEQLSGVLRVDSYFAPRLLPRLWFSLQLVSLEIHTHNSLPSLSSQSTALDGYYVSRPLMRSHRVMTVTLRGTVIHAELASPAGVLVLLKSYVSSDLLDCSTGTMEQLIDEFRVQTGISIPCGKLEEARLRFRSSTIHLALHVPRLRTIYALAEDWKKTVDEYRNSENKTNEKLDPESSKRTVPTTVALEGRVSLWLYNNCVTPLRVGQDETDEVVPLESGSKLAYRWRNPTATKKLRFAFAGPSSDWHWSNSISFSIGDCRIRLEDTTAIAGNSESPGSGVFLYVNVEQIGSNRCMTLSGRITIANILRFPLLYKVRTRFPDTNSWRTISTGELPTECVGRTVLCGANSEMILKLKFANHDVGWSGDIPIKECPKENVPWLVKVPSDGDVPYISVWCRIIRARYDARILATVWPLYVLHSHLPLDTDVLIVTETEVASPLQPSSSESQPPPLIQSAPGRATSTHLLAPGTTSARHSLSFQYRNIDCPVTREAVPLHYGVTDTSVFDKRSPVNNINEVLKDIKNWFARSSRGAVSSWPYSLVSKHWPGTWQPALLQPRCDVTVRYQAVRAGGGCSLEIHLSPVVLLCNASPLPLTLRAHDAAPLCKLEPGTAISPPSAILKKPFFMSLEKGRETFVSGQLEVSYEDPGRYGTPSPGRVAIDHPANFAIQCNHKVALFTLYYEIKEQINVLGISSTYTVINMLNSDILVSAIAVSGDDSKNTTIHAKTLKVIQPAKDDEIRTIPMSRFWLCDRWRGGDASQLNAFLCLALPCQGKLPASAPIPIRLGKPPVRRALALIDVSKKSMPIVVTQHKHEGRWMVTIAKDPCPQFVVHNRTRNGIAIGQPVQTKEEPTASLLEAVPDCIGAHWFCVVNPEAVLHYSTPAYCGRHPTQSDMSLSVPFLTFSRIKEDSEPDWCPPVAATDGEQLVQICRGLTVKLRVHTYPHSSIIELQDVDQTDISASDIRRRLIGSSISESIGVEEIETINTETRDSIHLNRTGAEDKLFCPTEEEGEVGDEMLEGVQIYSETSLATSQRMAPELVEKREICKPQSVQLDLATEDFQESLETSKTATGVDSALTIAQTTLSSEACSFVFQENTNKESERIRCIIESIAIEISSAGDTSPLLALHIDRAALLISSQSMKTRAVISMADVQIDNLQYDTGQYDFAVITTTRADPLKAESWPALWNVFANQEAFSVRENDARLLLSTCHDTWTVNMCRFTELTELDVRLGPLALYVEDAYVTALAELFRQIVPSTTANDIASILAEAKTIQKPLRLRLLNLQPLDLTLTLHTAVRMYIALDQSPLHLNAFKLQNMMTSTEQLAHALTVHYLSAAILGAGWVVGGLELLGAPGALAARVGGATGGVRGIASATAAALLRSLSAWAGSLARNLDILAGDEEHARRAAAARRRPPDSFMAGLITGITNFAINILGAVGGLAHHPLVGVAVGESESGATALRRGLLGALTKPLSATADLVAYAGHGLLKQTGWDPVPQPRPLWTETESVQPGWRRDCVRWTFRLAEMSVLSGFEVLLNNAHLQLLLTHKYIVVAEHESERVVEMIDLRFCSMGPYQGQVIELYVSQRRSSKVPESRVMDDDDEYQVSAVAMARVARYTGAEGSAVFSEARVLSLLPALGQSHALHAALTAAIHHNSDTHFPLL